MIASQSPIDRWEDHEISAQNYQGMDGNYSSLVTELQRSRESCLRQEQENAVLQSGLRKTINDSAYGKEFEQLAIDREAMARAIEQLKIEKSHLVETVLLLSGEVEEANRVRQDDQIKFKQQVLRHADNDKALRARKYRMGMQILELLKIRGVDQAVCHDVQQHVTQSCIPPRIEISTPGPFQSHYSDSNERKSSQHSNTDETMFLSGSGRVDESFDSASHGETSSRSRIRERSLRRTTGDNTIPDYDSVISSVSNHRSRESASQKQSRRSNYASITAEALTALNRQNSPPKTANDQKQVKVEEPTPAAKGWW